MNNSNAVRDAGRTSEPLLERLRAALAHDLRTPLGTIGNYATILEYHDQGKPEELRAFALRIRASVVRTATMLGHMTDALTLALRQPSGKQAEPAAILRSLLAELGMQGRFPAQGSEPQACAELDAELLRFCWRAFLGANAVAPGGLDMDVSCSQSDGCITVDLWIGAERDSQRLEPIESEAFFQRCQDSPAQEACFALSLADKLVASRGGSLELLGRAGAASQLRLRLPSLP